MLGAGYFTHMRHATVDVLVAVVMLPGSVTVGVWAGERGCVAD